MFKQLHSFNFNTMLDLRGVNTSWLTVSLHTASLPASCYIRLSVKAKACQLYRHSSSLSKIQPPAYIDTNCLNHNKRQSHIWSNNVFISTRHLTYIFTDFTQMIPGYMGVLHTLAQHRERLHQLDNRHAQTRQRWWLGAPTNYWPIHKEPTNHNR